MAGNKGHMGGRVSRQGDGPPGIGGSLVCDTEAPPPTVGPTARVCGARAESWPDRKENSLEFLPCPPHLPARSRLGPTLPLRDGGKPTGLLGPRSARVQSAAGLPGTSRWSQGSACVRNSASMSKLLWCLVGTGGMLHSGHGLGCQDSGGERVATTGHTAKAGGALQPGSRGNDGKLLRGGIGEAAC